MKDFVSLGADIQSIYFMSTRLLKDKIDGVRVTKFQLAYTSNTTNPPHKKLVKLCHEVHHIWLGNQDLELREWEDFIKSD